MVQFSEYQKEVLRVLQQSTISGKERENMLKYLFIKNHNLEEVDYNLYLHIEDLYAILCKIYTETKQEESYSSVLEYILNSLNYKHLGLLEFKGLTDLEIQYLCIILKIKSIK